MNVKPKELQNSGVDLKTENCCLKNKRIGNDLLDNNTEREIAQSVLMLRKVIKNNLTWLDIYIFGKLQ